MFDGSMMNGDFMYSDTEDLCSVRFKIRLPWYRQAPGRKIRLRPTAYGGYADVGRATGRFLADQENAEYIRIRSARQSGFLILRGGRADMAAYTEKPGAPMGLEIHAPGTIESPQRQKEIETVQRIDSLFLGFIPDCGSFASRCAKPYLDKFTRVGVPAEIRKRIIQPWGAGPDADKMIAEMVGGMPSGRSSSVTP